MDEATRKRVHGLMASGHTLVATTSSSSSSGTSGLIKYHHLPTDMMNSDSKGMMVDEYGALAASVFATHTFVEGGDSKSVEDSGILVEKFTDPCGPYLVSERVKLTVEKWGATAAIPPDKFLQRILSSRGYPGEMIESMNSPCRRMPTQKEIEDYDSELVTAVRYSDLPKIKSLRDVGRSMTACNPYGESIFHMACRRADFDVVDYLVNNIEEIWVVDDFGRTPLHDACWRSEPRFDIVTLLLDKNLNLLRGLDIRGANPLNYVREEHWIQWCAYLFHQKDKYWKAMEMNCSGV